MARGAERRAIARSIELLKQAQILGSQSRVSVEAIFFTNKLWAILIEDLAKPENALSAELKAKIISIGLWVLREAELISNHQSSNYRGLIDVSLMIHEGLQ